MSVNVSVVQAEKSDKPANATAAEVPNQTEAPRHGGVLNELVDECVCPISQSLMVDPVMAADGHTYDKSQIQSWIKQEESTNRGIVRSPQTREPLENNRLVPNVALRRTIERLINSGQLPAGVVAEWKESKEAMQKSASSEKRDKSLACAPIGTKIVLRTMLAPNPDPALDEAYINGTRPFHNMVANLHAATGSRGGGGLFGGNRKPQPGRLLVANMPTNAVLKVASTPDDEENTKRLSKIVDFMAEAEALPPAPMAAERLISSVFNDKDAHGFGIGFGRRRSCDSCSAVEHIIRRLASIENGLPKPVQEEWAILDAELQRRGRADDLKTLRQVFSETTFDVHATVQAVDDNGSFTLAFSSMDKGDGTTFTAQVPSDFIGAGGIVANSSASPQPLPRPGLFGAPAAAGPGFGAPAPRGLFGAGTSDRLDSPPLFGMPGNRSRSQSPNSEDGGRILQTHTSEVGAMM